jgi:hypothetical protein
MMSKKANNCRNKLVKVTFVNDNYRWKCVKLCKSLHSWHESSDRPRRFLIIFKYLKFHARLEKLMMKIVAALAIYRTRSRHSCPKAREMLRSHKHSRCLFMANSLSFKVCLRSLSVGKLHALFVPLENIDFPNPTTREICLYYKNTSKLLQFPIHAFFLTVKTKNVEPKRQRTAIYVSNLYRMCKLYQNTN